MTTPTLFTGGRLLDPRWDDGPRDGYEVLVEGGTIREVSDRPITSELAERVDLGGRVLMPGLIDAHVHVNAAMADLAANAAQLDSIAAIRASHIMHAMLMRGFTTVRDVGGADNGLKEAQALGLVTGPRLVISGKALSQTGGHCDSRPRNDDRPFFRRVGSMGRLVDGVDEVRRAAREELRAGADFIKVMANGGIASPADPIHMLQFSRAELEAAVEEASNLGTYVSAHLYTDEAIRRALECGVHSLEHCNLIQPETARLAKQRGAIAVPTLITYERLAVEASSLGMKPESTAKIETVRRAGLESIGIMHSAGLPMAYGTDLLGEMHRHQSGEFALRARVLPAIDVLRSATTLAAQLLGLEGRAGIVEPGADADLLVVDANPLDDWSVLEQQGARIPGIMQAGNWVKRAA
jgi:imidazolonepropionase-like amidohydrolase